MKSFLLDIYLLSSWLTFSFIHSENNTNNYLFIDKDENDGPFQANNNNQEHLSFNLRKYTISEFCKKLFTARDKRRRAKAKVKPSKAIVIKEPSPLSQERFSADGTPEADCITDDYYEELAHLERTKGIDADDYVLDLAFGQDLYPQLDPNEYPSIAKWRECYIKMGRSLRSRKTDDSDDKTDGNTAKRSREDDEVEDDKATREKKRMKQARKDDLVDDLYEKETELAELKAKLEALQKTTTTESAKPPSKSTKSASKSARSPSRKDGKREEKKSAHKTKSTTSMSRKGSFTGKKASSNGKKSSSNKAMASATKSPGKRSFRKQTSTKKKKKNRSSARDRSSLPLFLIRPDKHTEADISKFADKYVWKNHKFLLPKTMPNPQYKKGSKEKKTIKSPARAKQEVVIAKLMFELLGEDVPKEEEDEYVEAFWRLYEKLILGRINHQRNYLQQETRKLIMKKMTDGFRLDIIQRNQNPPQGATNESQGHKNPTQGQEIHAQGSGDTAENATIVEVNQVQLEPNQLAGDPKLVADDSSTDSKKNAVQPNADSQASGNKSDGKGGVKKATEEQILFDRSKWDPTVAMCWDEKGKYRYGKEWDLCTPEEKKHAPTKYYLKDQSVELPTAKELTWIATRDLDKFNDPDRRKYVADFYVGELLLRDIGAKEYGEKNYCYTRLSKILSPYDEKTKLVTPLSEAMVILNYENCMAKWKTMWFIKHNVYPSNMPKNPPSRYVVANGGHQQTDGWSQAGKERFKVLIGGIKDSRMDKARVRQAEETLLQDLREKRGITEATPDEQRKANRRRERIPNEPENIEQAANDGAILNAIVYDDMDMFCDGNDSESNGEDSESDDELDEDNSQHEEDKDDLDEDNSQHKEDKDDLDEDNGQHEDDLDDHNEEEEDNDEEEDDDDDDDLDHDLDWVTKGK